MKVVVDKPVIETDATKVVEEKETEKAKNLPAVLVTPQWQSDKALDQEIVQLYIDDLKRDGFAKGAVVVAAALFQENRIDPHHWGFIVGHNTEHISGKLMRLIKVKWANGSYEDLSEKALKLVYYPWWHNENELKDRLMSTSYP